MKKKNGILLGIIFIGLLCLVGFLSIDFQGGDRYFLGGIIVEMRKAGASISRLLEPQYSLEAKSITQDSFAGNQEISVPFFHQVLIVHSGETHPLETKTIEYLLFCNALSGDEQLSIQCQIP